MSWVAAIVVVGATTAMVSANQKKQAAKGALGAAQSAFERNWNAADSYYDRASGTYKPYIDTGQAANKKLGEMTGPEGELGRQFTQKDFKESPSYAFDLQEQMKALQRSQSGRGGMLSGGTMKALQDRSSQVANREWNNERNAFQQWQNQNYNQLNSLSQQGLQAGQGLTQADTNRLQVQTGASTALGKAQGDYYTNVGAANSAAVQGVGNSIIKGLTMYGSGMGGDIGGGDESVTAYSNLSTTPGELQPITSGQMSQGDAGINLNPQQFQSTPVQDTGAYQLKSSNINKNLTT